MRHTGGHTEPATRSYDATMILSTGAIIIDAFVNNFNCSNHDVTMVSGSQATVRTCNDHSGSKVRNFSSRCGRHDTLALLTIITKVLVECIIEPASNEIGPVCVSDFNKAIKRKCRNWQNILPYRCNLFIAADIMVITNRKEGLHLNFHNGIEYIWIHINMISFSFLYGS